MAMPVQPAFGRRSRCCASTGSPTTQVPRVGAHLESWLRQTGEFGEVKIHKVIASVGNTSSESATAAAVAMAQNLLQQEGLVDPKCRPLGLMFANSFRSFSAERRTLDCSRLGLPPR
jgi:hypothetical protein